MGSDTNAGEVTSPPWRLAELVAVLALATDVGMGQPMGHSLRTALLAMRLATLLGLDDGARQELFYLALVRRIGCTSDAHELTAWFGDDVDAHGRGLVLDFGNRAEVLGDIVRHAGSDRDLVGRVKTIAWILAQGEAGLVNLFTASCEVAERFAERLGLGSLVAALGCIFERWDGRGFPRRLRGEAIPLPVRIVQVVECAEVYHRAAGLEGAVAAVAGRAGRGGDPELSRLFVAHAADFAEALEEAAPWRSLLAVEPGPVRRVDDAGLDRFAAVVGDFADLKSPYFAGHSAAVAHWTRAAARALGLPASEAAWAARAGWMHDLGVVAVPSRVWEKRGPLSDGERELVRLHPYHTGRILSHCEWLATCARIAAAHHENLDGSGYPHGATGSGLPLAARILAAADRYHALVSDRPHRRALSPAAAAAALAREGRDGRLDGEAAAAVLAVAVGRPPQPAAPAGRLTAREIEVLRLVARGRSKGEVAACLGISRHTADHHLRHVYEKIGVSTRAAATLYAVEHGLLEPAGDPAAGTRPPAAPADPR